MFDARTFRKNLSFLLTATRGGPMRARILGKLLEKPLNPNMLAQDLGVDYKTITHHLDVLRKNNLVTGSGQKYAELYKHAFTEDQKLVFLEVCFGVLEKRLNTRLEGDL